MNDDMLTLIYPILRRYGVTIKDVLSKDRSEPVSICRHLCIKAVKDHTRLGLVDLGVLFGRHHTTILNSIRAAENIIFFDHEVKNLMKSLKIPERNSIYVPNEKIYFQQVTFA